VAASRQEAGELALKAGVDVDLGAHCYAQLKESVESGRVPMAVLDRAVKRVLLRKFEAGLFDHPYVDESAAAGLVRTPEHVATAAQAAREGVVLLKNNGILPLKPGTRIALIGPNADNQYNQLGDYTAPQAEDHVVTMREGLEAKGASVQYVKGCAVRDTRDTQIGQAIVATFLADVAVVVVGGSSARDFKTKYIDTGAAVVDGDSVSDMEAGEGFDRASLELLGAQNELLKAVKSTGKPVVVVYVEGRPLDKNWAAEKADALLTMWYPGGEGGTALADVLFGDYNPAGRLPVSVPRSAGQLPVYYNKKNPRGHDYVEMSADPLYPFGYGLSYSTFAYSDLTVSGRVPEVEVTVNVKNTGAYDGDEVVQLYVIDPLASTVRPRKQLRAFDRVFIKAGETVPVTLKLGPEAFSLVDASGATVIERGDFILEVGASSEDIRLKETITY
jgi:beta-glucosidase